jgi:hypothetical protein
VRLPASCVAVAVLLLLSGCKVAPPVPPPPPAALLPLPPLRPPPPAEAREAAIWHFARSPGACTAAASGRTARLQITLRAGHPALFVFYAARGMKRQGPTASGALDFHGAGGGWTAIARIGPGSLAVAALRLDDQTVGRVALLLDGGILTPVGAAGALPVLLLPPAGAEGRHWYGCARGLLF